MSRSCGDCQLCCRLLAVVPLKKLAGQRCVHQKFKVGCKVYNAIGMPPECSIWSCRWLVGDDTADLARPDRSHYVIDIMPDFVTATNDGTSFDIEVIQVWVDPAHPDAHRDPALRAYLDRRGREGIIGLIRYNATEAFTLIPPSLTGDGKWYELAGESTGRTHDFAEIATTIGMVR